MYKIVWKTPLLRDPAVQYEHGIEEAKAFADERAAELLVAEVVEYHKPDASDAKRVYLAVPDRLHLYWSMNGRRVVVVAGGTEQFVQIGGEVVKIVIAPKPRTHAQKKQDFLHRLDKMARNACPPLVSKAEQDNMYHEWARGYEQRVRQLGGRSVPIRASSIRSLKVGQV